MSNAYSLTVINNSQLDRPTFAVFATLPVSSSYATLSLAWLTQDINATNQYKFSWDITWGFTWAAQGVLPDYAWSGSGKLPADPISTTQCAANFSYNGDFQLTPTQGTPDGQTLTISDSPQVPLPKDKASSVGITLSGETVCVTNAGPNLFQTFTLHPTYYISAGNYVQGQMVDGSSVARYQKLEYSGGNTALTATLNEDNTWAVQDSASLNLAEMFAARSAN